MKRFDLKKLGKPKSFVPFSNRLLRGFVKYNFCVEAKGKGMTPKINDGDLLICSVCTEFRNGAIVVLWNGKELHCKYRLITPTEDVIYQNAKQEIFNSDGYEVIGVVLSKFSHI